MTFSDLKLFIVEHPIVTGILLTGIAIAFWMILVWYHNDADDRREEMERKNRDAKYKATIAQRHGRLNVVAGKSTGRTVRTGAPINRRTRKDDVA